MSVPKHDGGAQPPVTATRYAVKVVPSIAMSQRKPHNVRNEAMILSKLSHVNIVEIKSAFYHAQQDIYELHMPYIDLPLIAILSHPHFSALPFPSYLQSPPLNPFSGIELSKTHASLTRSIMFQVLSALAYIHGQNPPIAHRDINPGNILLTRNGTAKLVDFGIAWDPGLEPCSIVGEDGTPGFDWEEDPEDMCGQVATGPYRAPELMYSPKVYDACSTDLWSTGVMMASFYTPIHLDLDDDDISSSDSSDNNHATPGSTTPGYVIPSGLQEIPHQANWRRDTIFDATRGEIALLWSIFRVMGTPSTASWPDFPGHQEGSLIRFRDAERQPLAPLLPHLPIDVSEPTPLKMIEAFLAYPPAQRLTATQALRHSWFTDEGPVLLPVGYPVDPEITGLQPAYQLEGKNLEDILSSLVRTQERLVNEKMEPRDEWD